MLQARLYNDFDCEIIIVGSGTSNLGQYLYQQGYHFITNIDFSSVVIEHMKGKHNAMDEMDYQEHDITDPD